MEPKRVLHIVGNMGAGGMETLIMNLYRKIDREKLQFDFLVHKPQKAFYEDEIKGLGGNVYHMTVLKDWNFLKYKRDLKEFFENHKEYKVVHGHHSSLGNLYLSIAEKAGIPCRISHSHIASFSKSIRGVVKKIIVKDYGKHASYHFACSNAAGKYMYGNDEYMVVNNGIDTSKFAFSVENREKKRKELSIEEKLVVVHVGRFFDQKNHAFLIEIFYEIVKKKENSVLLLVGVGPLQENIRNKVKKLGLEDKVVFMNSRNDVNEILFAADLFVFPSLYEGLPLTLVEAQAAGLPVVCSNTITDETNLTDLYCALPLTHSAEYWAKKSLEMFENFKDSLRGDWYKEIAAKDYDIKTIAQNLQDFYLKQYC